MRALYAALAALLISLPVAAQTFPGPAPAVVINEMFNESSHSDEWTELLVIQDDLDLRGWFIQDNNATTDSWQPATKFNNIPLWQHLRRGTYIILQHADDNAGCSVQDDIDKSDGFIRVCVRDPQYFTGGTSSTMFLNSVGDFVHLVDPTNKHISGVGFDSDPGGSVTGSNCRTTSSNWTDDNSVHANTPPCGPFVFVKGDMPNGQSLAHLEDTVSIFNISNPGLILNNAVNIRYGLTTSSQGHGNNAENARLIARLRRPTWISETRCIIPQNAGNRLEWTPVVDPYPTDQTIGYLILRSTVQQMAMPDQGREYAVNSTIGTGPNASTVIGVVKPSTTSFFVDNNPIQNGFYRVVAFRYSPTPGSSGFTDDRGTAYNTAQYFDFTPGGSPEYQVQGTNVVCVGDTVRFTATGLPPNLVPRWSFDTVTGAKVTVLQNSETLVAIVRDETPARDSVKVTLTFTDASACNLNVTLHANAQVRPRPTVTITPADTLASPNTDVQFHIEITGTTDVISVPALDITPPSDNVTLRYLGGDTSLIVTGLIRNLPGCTGSDTATIHQKDAPVSFKYNNIVTNNPASANYYFTVQGATFRNLVIYNRWGKPVYKAGRYDNTWRGEAGTYFFTATTIAPCTTLDCDPVVTAYKGWIEVVK